MTLVTKTFINNHLNYEQQKMIFNTLFENVNGYELSLKDKQALSLQLDRSFTYGEVSFEGFKAVLDVITPAKDIEFMDFGSGLGKALVIAALFFPCKRLVGVEKLPTLAEKSKDILNSFSEDIKKSYPDVELPSLSIINDGFDSVSLSTVDVLFFSATCFSDETVTGLSSRVHEMKSGAYIVSFTRQIQSNHLECIYKGSHKMDWGTPTVYIYQRKS